MSGSFCFRSDSRLVGAGQGSRHRQRPLENHRQFSPHYRHLWRDLLPPMSFGFWEQSLRVHHPGAASPESYPSPHPSQGFSSHGSCPSPRTRVCSCPARGHSTGTTTPSPISIRKPEETCSEDQLRPRREKLPLTAMAPPTKGVIELLLHLALSPRAPRYERNSSTAFLSKYTQQLIHPFFPLSLESNSSTVPLAEQREEPSAPGLVCRVGEEHQ